MAEPSAAATTCQTIDRSQAFSDLYRLFDDPLTAWESLRPGVGIHRLYTTPDGRSAALLRYEPGASLPRHRHVGYEQILVLAGSQEDDHGSYNAGALIVHPPGSSHAIRSATGCTVLAIWEQPVVFE